MGKSERSQPSATSSRRSLWAIANRRETDRQTEKETEEEEDEDEISVCYTERKKIVFSENTPLGYMKENIFPEIPLWVMWEENCISRNTPLGYM